MESIQEFYAQAQSSCHKKVACYKPFNLSVKTKICRANCVNMALINNNEKYLGKETALGNTGRN